MRQRCLWAGALIGVGLLTMVGLQILLFAQEKAPAASPIVVKLVTDFDSARPVSDLEEFRPVKTTVFDANGSHEVTLGEKAVLWVRNAHVDGKFFFERYYQEKYIGRNAVLEIEAGQLGPGEHVIQPGNHKFALAADGKLSSTDADVRIAGNTVLLKLHPVTVSAVDAARTGPAEFRLQPADVGVLSLDADVQLDPKSLPDPALTHDPRKPTPKAKDRPGPLLTNVLSHQKAFYPLTVWLPANQTGQGYVLYPSWQAFHLRPDGTIDLGGGQAPRVKGVDAEGGNILIAHRQFGGRINSRANLTAGVGAARLAETFDFGATLAPVKFRAGYQDTPADFFLPVDNDWSQQPHKFFVADNTTGDKDAIRMLALEWQDPAFPRGAEVRASLRFLETAGKETLTRPDVQVSWSEYNPSNPVSRVWQPLPLLGWSNGRDTGELRFRAPDVDFRFVAIRVQVVDAGKLEENSPLWAEMLGCVLQPGQKGTASFVTNKGRNAFVAGENIDLALVFRSQEARPVGQRKVTLAHPGGHVESLAVEDRGDPWFTQDLRLPAERTVNLAPGRYTLTLADVPAGIVALPFAFDLVGRDKHSLFHIVKTSKYTQSMNGLEPSHLQRKPIDLDRAVATMADLGFNRVDLMSYMTNHHLRAYTWREGLTAADSRLPPPAAVVTPSPRDQILNACVRQQMQYADVWLSYGDFHLPRHIEGYIRASERWMAREIQGMRHSPAFDGMMLYDEMYQTAAVGFVKEHHTLFPKIRARVAEEQLGQAPSKIEEAFNRFLQRPPSQRDPKALEAYLQYVDWQQHGWADYVNRVVGVGRGLAPAARFGTYHRTWLLPGANDEIYHGYPPDLFKNLDIISHVHYADNSTCWVSIPLLAQALRTGQGKTLYLNMPLGHEGRTENDGQYQRHMAFAQLAQGANGVAQWGTPHTFEDGPNPGTAQGRDTTGPLNREILAPFGELADRTDNGYRKVGIVSTFNQHALGQHKQLPAANMTEGIWIACWRLGYPAVFVREEHMQANLDGFSVLFVPGVRFDNELTDQVVQRLREAMAAGVKVVVEGDSVLDLPGLIKLKDWKLDSYYLGPNYFPTWLDDELNKVYERSQPIVDYLGPKLDEWGVEPAARGPFTVGPNWRDGGQAQYLIMANFEDPPYTHTVKQQMARPVVMPLTVAGHRGRVAYDLLAQQELELKQEGSSRVVTLDMRRIQGALVAFLPERIGSLRVKHAVSADPGRLRLNADVVGESGQALDAVFPARITLTGAGGPRVFHRVLGRGRTVELDLPLGPTAPTYQVEIREALSGRVVEFAVQGGVFAGPNLVLEPRDVPAVPRPQEVQAFLKNAKKAVIVPSHVLPGVGEQARELQQILQGRGIEARIADETSVHRAPTGNPKEEDPFNDGFHSWHSGQETIGPALVVDEPVILLAGRGSSFLLDALADHGYLSVAPLGGPGQPVRPSIQVAAKGLHFGHDTLCLIANDAAGMKRNVEYLRGDLISTDKPVDRLRHDHFMRENPTEGKQARPTTPVMSFMGTNELVTDIQFDRAGNLYAATWGHGKNLYSLSAAGQPRFGRHLPEMGPRRMSVHDDRLFAFTAAGNRLYALTLDNQPLAQARMNMDPGATVHCDNYSLADIDFRWVPSRKQLVHNHGDRMRVLDEQFRIVAEWRGEEYRDKDVSDEILHRGLHAFAISPDGQRIAQLEASMYFTKWAYMDQAVYDTHLVIRDFQGKLLHEYRNLDNGKDVTAGLLWPAGAAGPIAHVKDERLAFGPDLQLLQRAPRPDVVFELGDEGCLVRRDRELVYQDRFGHDQCRLGPFAVMPTFAGSSADGGRIALLDEYGAMALFGTSDGKQLARFQVPERGRVLRFSADGQRLLLGTFRGSVLAYDLAGKLLWQARLGELNDVLGQEPPLYDPAFPDHSDKLWPIRRDEPGELDKLVRLDGDRLVNGDMEAANGWQGQMGVTFHPEGYQSGRSLKVGEAMVGQEAAGFLGQHATWVLEFFYRAAEPGAKPELLAGLMAQAEQPDSVARRFPAGPQWQFGRVVIKNGSNCQKLAVGFAGQGGAVLVDRAQLRRVRFPSINHLLYEPFHAVKPVVCDNQLYITKYNPFGALKEQAPSKIFLPPTPGGSLPQVDAGFLQNGRLNDLTSNWYVQPYSRDGDLVIALNLKEPRWISMVALYFNAYDPSHVAPHVDILATDLEAKQDRLVASVRHNGQVFRLVKFAPVKTSLVKLRLVHSIARLRTFTEVELYGPLSGREGTPGFDDPDGQNTYMGDFSRVDRREKKLPEVFQAPLMVNRQEGSREDIVWYAPLAQVLAARDRFHVARALGKTSGYDLAAPDKETYFGRPCALGFSPLGTLYGGLLLRGGNDGKLYCLNPETGTELWSVKVGERLTGCPVALDADVFVATDTGKLVQVDLASGGILKEVPLSGPVFGSLATDGQRLFFLSDDGFLHCYRVADMSPVWKLAAAPFTDATPAVADGVVYLADQKGTARAVAAADGKLLWQTELGDEFCRCPVVGADRVIFGCRGGTLAVLNRSDGKKLWAKPAGSRFDYEPLLLDDQLLYFRGNKAMLARLADGQEKPFEITVAGPKGQPAAPPRPFTLSADPVVPLSYYRGNLFFIDRPGDAQHNRLEVNAPWHPNGGAFTLLRPATEERK